MPRTPRLDAPHLVQHVLARGIEQRDIFLDDSDRRSFVDRLGTVLTEEASLCYGWVLMPNHVHLLLRVSTSPLATVMRRLLGSYATYFNLRHERSGHLFQNRYKSIVVQEDGYLSTLVAYIHLNPLRAGIVRDVRELEDYRWSGHQALIGRARYSWQDTEFVAAFFEDQGSYVEAVSLAAHEEPPDLDGGGLRRSLAAADRRGGRGRHDHRVLGAVTYVGSALSSIDSRPAHPDLAYDLNVYVCDCYGITPAELTGSARPRTIAQARAVYAVLAKEHGLSAADIGRALRMTEAAAARAIDRGRSAVETSPQLRSEFIKRCNKYS